MSKIGDWANNINEMAKEFIAAKPYPHLIIDNFCNADYIESLHESYPVCDSKWIKYWNPFEKKYALNNFENNHLYNELFNTLQSVEFVNLMKNITGIHNLESDPYLHGAGIHYMPNGCKLDMHLDYSVHPITKKERRVNLIIYMNKDWDESYNGDLQLWDKEFTKSDKCIYPKFNRAVIFQTNDISYHGIPKIIKCPENVGRKSIAIYYVSDQTNIGQVRNKAHYLPLPNQNVNEKLKKLYSIRNTGIITNDILQSVYPDWKNDVQGYW